ncbi:DUF1697 domain-containing protein [Cellulosimicrobium sp. CUA-896]|uniref:DUF1697 domain-containing protein n=1 Tax=Cellulosimicrobium sp. CUA-896 TaxID=1517881 RepID=UPI000962A247|nr:DUF1697 domain-containing protein [Cellulosimicrobium sp. CUA-896]OLT49528.1 hypothetical protein BJF88_15875 [Cellulosimicrobium sp. CUA-896]
MTAYVALLFAVNVGGRSVPSTALRALSAELGFAGGRTVVNSGNLVVAAGSSGATSADDVGRLVRAGVAERFGVDATVAVLATERLAEVLEANPFTGTARETPARVQVLVGERDVDADGVARLAAEHAGPEEIAAAQGVLYVTYPDGIGRSRLTTTALARAAGTPVTGRNWNTVTRLLATAREVEAPGS